ncbi:hypothetical protein BDR26DRAFT_933506 [Obelidium mucronatum]|nr:hypothetical protein BDR26DRAFT_933506 [Obelidium mucronatum]
MDVFSLPELVDQIALHLPPNELYKLGRLNQRCRSIAHLDILSEREYFARRNLQYYIATTKATKSFHVSSLPFLHLGVHYVSAFFHEFGFNATSLGILLKKHQMNWSQTPPFWNHTAWNDIMPDAFWEDRRELVFNAFKNSVQPSPLKEGPAFDPKHDPILCTYWSCHFQDAFLAEKSIQGVLHLKMGNQPEVTHILAGAFFFAYNSGNAEVTGIVLDTRKVDLLRWGPQALADASRLGHVQIVELLLQRSELDFKEVGNKAAVCVAFNWARENGHFEVVEALLSAGLTDGQSK